MVVVLLCYYVNLQRYQKHPHFLSAKYLFAKRRCFCLRMEYRNILVFSRQKCRRFFTSSQTWQPGCNCSLALDNSSASSLKTFNSEAAASISWKNRRKTLAVHDQGHAHTSKNPVHLDLLTAAHQRYMMHVMYTNTQRSCNFTGARKSATRNACAM